MENTAANTRSTPMREGGFVVLNGTTALVLDAIL